jgi:uncharacterized protein
VRAVPPTNPFISVDDHVQEHPGVWTDRLSATRWGDRVPHVEDQPDGSQRWVVDGVPLDLAGVAEAGVLMSDRAISPQRWEDVPAAACDSTARLAAMDADGVTYSALYPTVAGVAGQRFGRITDPDLELACVQAYNDWLLDEWASASPRFIPQCLVPIGPVDATVREIERAVARGHRGVVFPAIPMHLREVPHINEPDYDPVWDVCESLGVPLCFHAGSSPGVQLPPYAGMPAARVAALQAVTRPASAVFDVINLLFSRILLRHPRLRAIFAESSLGWGPFLLEYADHQFEQDHCEGYELIPSEMFKRQCFLTGWYEDVDVAARFIGGDPLVWATNFPMANSSWPRSQDTIERCFASVTRDVRDRVLWRNAADLYGLDVSEDAVRPMAQQPA